MEDLRVWKCTARAHRGARLSLYTPVALPLPPKWDWSWGSGDPAGSSWNLPPFLCSVSTKQGPSFL